MKPSLRSLLHASALMLPGLLRAGTTAGSCLEEWELRNFQPQSPTHEQLVKSSSYYGAVTVVALLASG